MSTEELHARLAALEARVAALEQAPEDCRSPVSPDLPADTFWALERLKELAGPDAGAVLFTGSVDLPTGEHYEWQEGRESQPLLDADWADLAAGLQALAHPVRLHLLREILHGVRTTAELARHPDLGTSGQLYHHLRQLTAAGWLHSTARGHYAVPGERVIPLLIVLMGVRR